LVIEVNLYPTKVNNVDICSIISKAVKINEPATLKNILMNTLEGELD